MTTRPNTVNRPAPAAVIDLVVRPDRVEGLRPFTAAVMRTAMPENKVLPTMETYSGTTDPEKHPQSFMDAMVVYSPDDLVWCRVFSLSIKGIALD